MMKRIAARAGGETKTRDLVIWRPKLLSRNRSNQFGNGAPVNSCEKFQPRPTVLFFREFHSMGSVAPASMRIEDAPESLYSSESIVCKSLVLRRGHPCFRRLVFALEAELPRPRRDSGPDGCRRRTSHNPAPGRSLSTLPCRMLEASRKTSGGPDAGMRRISRSAGGACICPHGGLASQPYVGCCLAKAFFRKALTRHGSRARSPSMVSSRHIRRYAAWGCATNSISVGQSGQNRCCQYLNNMVEQDHRRIKLRIQPMLRFKSFLQYSPGSDRNRVHADAIQGPVRLDVYRTFENLKRRRNRIHRKRSHGLVDISPVEAVCSQGNALRKAQSS
jgi:hypothetical protein